MQEAPSLDRKGQVMGTSYRPTNYTDYSFQPEVIAGDS